MERLWPLTNEAIANRLFEQISEIEDVLVERCIELLDQGETVRNLTNYHWWPQSDDIQSLFNLILYKFRYEDLRAEALVTIKRIYSLLEIPVGAEIIGRVLYRDTTGKAWAERRQVNASLL